MNIFVDDFYIDIRSYSEFRGRGCVVCQRWRFLGGSVADRVSGTAHYAVDAVIGQVVLGD